MTIYVVTSGEYSGYGIDAIYTDRKQAELYCAVHEWCRIEEYEADQQRLEGEVYYGILARDFYQYSLRCEFFYSLKPIKPTVRINPKNTYLSAHDEYIIPVNKSYENRYEAMKKVARDYIAKMKAEEKGL